MGKLIGCVMVLLLASAPAWVAASSGKKKTGKKKKKKIKLPFSFSRIKLPSTRNRAFRKGALRGIKPMRPGKVRGKKGKKSRPPTRRIRVSGPLALRTRPALGRGGVVGKKRGQRGQVRVRKLRYRRFTRLVVYRRWLGRKGWVRRWLGHVIIRRQSGRAKLRFLCPKNRYCKKLKLQVRQARRAHPRKLSASHRSFAWNLRRTLERRHRYEIVVQVK